MRPTRRSVCAALAAPLFAVRSSLAAGAVSLTGAEQAGEGLPRLKSLLVNWHGETILEHYYHGARASRAANIKSASKTVMSALVGIAVDRGLIESVDTPISEFFPKLLGASADEKKRAITVGDLLTMRSGLETTSNRNYGSWVASSNWVRNALERPIIRDPGARMIYSTGNTHLLSAIITKIGGNTWKFADEVLAEPLGFDLPRWPKDPQGIYFGGNDMEFTPRQMQAFGEMYLNGGRSNGKQVISESWVRESFVPRTRSTRDPTRLYGYCWWIRELGGLRTFYAWGYGGQFIFVVPTLDLVVVTTSSTATGRDRRGHLNGIYDLLEDHIIRPISSATNQQLAD
ncbi:MAG: serine hydrolase [Acidobacteria bacterium]|nr:serine hydrolase [Acidobacteriota bacterium]MDA1236571.1 serine hydrolase [Acidobacteriota bacterium]